jgi:uncharacterized protein YecE (DUF72 family)
MSTPRLRMGTCTWNYDSWVGLVYSREMSGAAAYLPEYARRFETAEIDSWFYRIPPQSEVLRYKQAVSSDFRFTCKAPQALTLTHQREDKQHAGPQPNPEFLSAPLFQQFLQTIAPLLPQIDAVMLEFEYLNKSKMASLDLFLQKIETFIGQIPEGLPLALEPRNSNFVVPKYFEFIARHGLIHVFSEKQYMPHVYELYERQHDTIGKRAVIRLMGGDRQEMEARAENRWDRIIEPREDLAEIAAMIRKLLEHGTDVTVNVNNHYEGCAPLTIERLRSLLNKT